MPLHVCFVWWLHDRSAVNPQRMSLGYSSVAMAKFEIGHLDLAVSVEFIVWRRTPCPAVFAHPELWIRDRSSSLPTYLALPST